MAAAMKTAREITDEVVARLEADPLPSYPFTVLPFVASIVLATLEVLDELDYLDLEVPRE